MARFRTTVEVEGLDVGDAFDYLADFSSAAEWDPGVARAHRNEEGPIQPGSTFDVEASFMGRTIPLTYEIVEMRQGEIVVLRAENASVVSLDELTFAATDVGCSVTYDAELTGKGSFRVINPVLQWLFNRIGNAAEAGLAENLNRIANSAPMGGESTGRDQ